MDRPCNCPEGSLARFLISFCVYLLQKIGRTFSATIWMKLNIGQRIERKKSYWVVLEFQNTMVNFRKLPCFNDFYFLSILPTFKSSCGFISICVKFFSARISLGVIHWNPWLMAPHVAYSTKGQVPWVNYAGLEDGPIVVQNICFCKQSKEPYQYSSIKILLAHT